MERWRQKIFSPAAMRTNNVLFITIWSPPPCGPAWPHSLQTSDTRIREMPAAHLPMRGERPLAISTEPDPASGLVEAQGQMSAGSQAAVAVAYCRINSSDRQT